MQADRGYAKHDIDQGSTRSRRFSRFLSHAGTPTRSHLRRRRLARGFFASGGRARPYRSRCSRHSALIAAIPEASFDLAQALASKASRRGLIAAAPALKRLCFHLKGFGLDRAVPNRWLRLMPLRKSEGPRRRRQSHAFCARMPRKVQPWRPPWQLLRGSRVVLPEEKAASFLRHADPAVRADACRCAPFRPAAVAVLGELLHDLNAGAATAAACALGRMGQAEARPALLRQLRQAPTAEVIEAISEVACDEAIVLLGRIANSDDVLAGQAFEALEGIDSSRARRLVEILAGQGHTG